MAIQKQDGEHAIFTLCICSKPKHTKQTVQTNFLKNFRRQKIHNIHNDCTTTKMATNNNDKNVKDDEESLLSHSFSTSSKIANTQVREVVKDNVFPKAKFLRTEDMPHSDDPTSWCQKMASWCHIEPKNLQLWWQTSFQEELQHQRANKTNAIKREFFFE